MTDREKLIALLHEAGQRCGDIECYDGEECEYAGEINGCMAFIADHLIANGVVVQRWIPVTERLPEDGQTVIACVTHRFGDKSIIPMVFWHESYFHWQDVTHWMPLPEPPKEGE